MHKNALKNNISRRKNSKIFCGGA